jgi:magnesium-transporting ATPase (P-type)
MPENIQRNKNLSNARSFGSVVYIGGVLAATTLFISFVLTAFPADAYFSRLVMTVAGTAVGASMLAFPVALHNWIITQQHRKWGVPLYYGEMLIIAVNTVVSFVSLLAEYTGYAAPEWVILYEPFSVMSIIYTVFAWGTIFLTDPEAQRRALNDQFNEDYETEVAKTKLEFVKSAQGRAAILKAANEEIEKHVNQARSGIKDFATGEYIRDKPSEIAVEPGKGFVPKGTQMPPLPELDK